MENASKALLMAGGVLIALFTATLLVYLSTSSSRIANAYQQKQEKEQIRAFNKEYESYDKTIMYGTDIITVVNKAIDYNKRLDVEDEEYKINIELKLKQEFKRTKQTITQKSDGTIEEGDIVTEGEGTLTSRTYQLFEREGSIKMNDDIIQFFHQKSDDKTTITQGTTIQTTYEYSSITNFKTATFECTEVDYNDATGRINLMVFEQFIN